MGSIAFKGNGHDPVADHPAVKRLVADIAELRAKQTDMEQGLTLMHGLVVQLHERQEHLLAQTNFIVDWIKASGFTGAL